jgi:hypothetical protein
VSRSASWRCWLPVIPATRTIQLPGLTTLSWLRTYLPLVPSETTVPTAADSSSTPPAISRPLGTPIFSRSFRTSGVRIPRDGLLVRVERTAHGRRADRRPGRATTRDRAPPRAHRAVRTCALPPISSSSCWSSPARRVTADAESDRNGLPSRRHADRLRQARVGLQVLGGVLAEEGGKHLHEVGWLRSVDYEPFKRVDPPSPAGRPSSAPGDDLARALDKGGVSSEAKARSTA